MIELAEVQIKYNKKAKPRFVKVGDSAEAAKILFEIFATFEDEKYVDEHFVAMYFARDNRLLGWKQISKGGVSGTVADPKVIFRYGILLGASGIIMGHNHPSGNIKPSRADIKLTGKVKKAGELLDLKLLDHLVVELENQSVYSMADEGLV